MAVAKSKAAAPTAAPKTASAPILPSFERRVPNLGPVLVNPTHVQSVEDNGDYSTIVFSNGGAVDVEGDFPYVRRVLQAAIRELR